ncbi:MAG: methyltransferase domain-containing protein [Verrucomicrobia bacterium]|nr:methyltransferase domain-containing protein [Verrucomicrobiota bacterium]
MSTPADLDPNHALSAELQREYALRFTAAAEYRRRVWSVLTREFFQRWVPREGTVLDLGCGWGEFINQIEAGQKLAMDLNPDSRERLAPGIRFCQQDCSQRWEIEEASLDVVFTSNFFEHLRSKDALRDTVGEARRCLKPGGRLICLGPNVRHLAGAYWDFWDHYLPLTERSMGELLRMQGYDVEKECDRFLPYTMVGQAEKPIFLVHWYLRLPFLWKIFGRQFLVIARKPLPA